MGRRYGTLRELQTWRCVIRYLTPPALQLLEKTPSPIVQYRPLFPQVPKVLPLTPPLSTLSTPRDESVAGGSSSTGRGRRPSSPQEPARDPVCGMSVDPESTSHRHQHAGDTYYFCSAGCRSKFAAEPQKYLRHAPGKDTETSAHPQGAIYTCPMHPQIRQRAREPARSAAWRSSPRSRLRTSGGSAELGDMTRRFWISLALAVPVFALEMGGHVAGAHKLLGPKAGRIGFSSFSRRRWCSGAAGPSSCERDSLCVTAQPQHVHPDRDGHRRRLALQRRRTSCPRPLSAGLPRHGRRWSLSISKRLP